MMQNDLSHNAFFLLLLLRFSNFRVHCGKTPSQQWIEYLSTCNPMLLAGTFWNLRQKETPKNDSESKSKTITLTMYKTSMSFAKNSSSIADELENRTQLFVLIAHFFAVAVAVAVKVLGQRIATHL